DVPLTLDIAGLGAVCAHDRKPSSQSAWSTPPRGGMEDSYSLPGSPAYCCLQGVVRCVECADDDAWSAPNGMSREPTATQRTTTEHHIAAVHRRSKRPAPKRGRPAVAPRQVTTPTSHYAPRGECFVRSSARPPAGGGARCPVQPGFPPPRDPPYPAFRESTVIPSPHRREPDARVGSEHSASFPRSDAPRRPPRDRSVP